MKIPLEILDIWEPYFKEKNKNNNKRISENEEINVCFKNFPVWNFENLPRKYKQMSDEEKMETFVNLYHLNEGYNFDLFFRFINLVLNKKNNIDIRNNAFIFFIMYSYKIVSLLDNEKENIEQVLSLIRKLKEIKDYFFRIQPEYKKDFIKTINWVLSCFSPRFMNKIENKEIIKKLFNDFVQLMEKISIAECQNLLRFVFNLAYSCLKRGFQDDYLKEIYKSTILQINTYSKFSKFTEDDFKEMSSYMKLYCQIIINDIQDISSSNTHSILSIIVNTIVCMRAGMKNIIEKGADGNQFDLEEEWLKRGDVLLIVEKTVFITLNNLLEEKLPYNSEMQNTEGEITKEKVEEITRIFRMILDLLKEVPEYLIFFIKNFGPKITHITFIQEILIGFKDCPLNKRALITDGAAQSLFNEKFFNETSFTHQNILSENFYKELGSFITNSFFIPSIAKELINKTIKYLNEREMNIVDFILQNVTNAIKWHQTNEVPSCCDLKHFCEALRNYESFIKEKGTEKMITNYINFSVLLCGKQSVYPFLFGDEKNAKWVLNYINDEERKDKMLKMIAKILIESKNTGFLIKGCLEVKEVTNSNISFINDIFDKLMTAFRENHDAMFDSYKSIDCNKCLVKVLSDYSLLEDFDLQTFIGLIKNVLELVHTSTKLAEEYSISPFTFYNELLKVVEKFPIDKNMIKYLFDLSYGDTNGFITYNGLIYFLFEWAKSYPSIDYALEKLYSLVECSIANRYACFKSGILNILMNLLINVNNSKALKCFSTIGGNFFHKKELFNAFNKIKNKENPTKVIDALLLVTNLTKAKMPSSIFYFYHNCDSYFKVSDVNVSEDLDVRATIIMDNLYDEGTIIKIAGDGFTVELDKNSNKYELVLMYDDEEVDSTNIKFSSNTSEPLDITLTVSQSSISLLCNAKVEGEMKKKFGKYKISGNATIEIRNCYMSNISISQKKSKKQISFNVKNTNNGIAFSSSKKNAEFNGLAIKYIPTIYNSIVSCGGPVILLPILEEAMNVENPIDYISKTMDFISLILHNIPEEFKNKKFFLCMTHILKNMFSKFPEIENHLQIGIKLYSSLNTVKVVKDEVERDMWPDLSFVSNFPQLIPLVYKENPEIVKLFGSIEEFSKNVINDEYEHKNRDKSISKNMYELLLLVKEEFFSYEKDLETVFINAFDINNRVLSRIFMHLLNDLINENETAVLNYVKEYGYYQPVLKIMLSDDSVIQGYALNFLANVCSKISSKELNNFATEIRINKSDDWEVVLSYAYHLLTNTDFKSFDEFNPSDVVVGNIVNQHFLPFICCLLYSNTANGEELTESAKKVIDALYSSIIENGSKILINKLYCVEIIYIGYVLNDLEKWFRALYPLNSTYIFTDVFAAIFATTDSTHANVVCSFIESLLENKAINNKNIETFSFGLAFIVNYKKENALKMNHFKEFASSIGDQKLDLIPTNPSKEYVNILKDFINYIAEGFNILNSDNSWILFANLLKLTNDDEFIESILMKVNEYVKSSDNSIIMISFITYLIKIMKETCHESISLQILSSMGFTEEKISVFSQTSNKMIKDTNSYFISYVANFISSFIPHKDNYINEFILKNQIKSSSIKNISMLNFLTKKNGMVWENIKKNIESSVNGIWSTNKSIQHKMFDSAIDKYGRHFRTRINFDYKDHLDASKLRDSGIEVKSKNVIKMNYNHHERHQVTESVSVFDGCSFLKVDKIYTGKLYVTSTGLLFESEKRALTMKPKEVKYRKYIEVDLSKVTHVLWRRKTFISKAVELFTEEMTSYFFIFSSKNERNKFISVIKRHVPKRSVIQEKEVMDISSYTEQWKTQEMSTYEYLYWVNMYAGRSFNDITQYPVFPWVIKSDEEVLDLNNDDSFRDLSKPMGAQTEERLNMLKENMDDSGDPLSPTSCLYRSCYMSSAYVLLYLMRLEPFTTLHILLQDNMFELPNRLFYSIPISWEGASSKSCDFRELIPEFFSFSSFLINSEKFDLGILDSGERANDVKLPQWAKNAPQYIMMNRYALECPFVSQNIGNWIDLIFGYKQDGEEALKADNVFYGYLYPSCLSCEDVIAELANATSEDVGCIPEKLFENKHPEKIITQEISSFSSIFHTEIENCNINIPNVVSMFVDNNTYYIFTSDSKLFTLKRNKNVLESNNKVIEVPFTIDSLNHFLVFPRSDCKQIVVSSPFKDTFDVYKLNKMELVKTSQIHMGTITCIGGYEPTGIVSCCQDSSVFIWKSLQLEDKTVITAHTEEVVIAQSSASLDAVVTIDKSGLMIVSSALTGNPYTSISLHNVPISLHISPNGYIVVIFNDQLLNRCRIEVYELNGSLVSTTEVDGNVLCSYCANFIDLVEFLFVCIGTEFVVYRLCDMKEVNRTELKQGFKSICFDRSNSNALVSLENGDICKLHFLFST